MRGLAAMNATRSAAAWPTWKPSLRLTKLAFTTADHIWLMSQVTRNRMSPTASPTRPQRT
jgi:hypothetical protein